MEIRSKLVRNLTAEEYKACWRLNMGPRGSMRMNLESAREGYHEGARVVMAMENNVLMGWALLFVEAGVPVVHTYVRASCRRKGVGTRILKRVQRLSPEAKCCPWNRVAKAFYSRFDLAASPAYDDLYSY